MSASPWLACHVCAVSPLFVANPLYMKATWVDFCARWRLGQCWLAAAVLRYTEKVVPKIASAVAFVNAVDAAWPGSLKCSSHKWQSLKHAICECGRRTQVLHLLEARNHFRLLLCLVQLVWWTADTGLKSSACAGPVPKTTRTRIGETPRVGCREIHQRVGGASVVGRER